MARPFVAQLMRDRTSPSPWRAGAASAAAAVEPALDRVVVGPIVARQRFDGADLSLDGPPVAATRRSHRSPRRDVGPDVGRGGDLYRPPDAGWTRRHRRRRAGAAGAARRWSAWGATGVRGARRTSGTPAAGPARSSPRGARDLVGAHRRRLPVAHRAVDHRAAAADRRDETWEARPPALGRVGPRHRVPNPPSGTRSCSRARSCGGRRHGGLGLRGPRAWSGGTGRAVMTSEGRTRRNATRLRARGPRARLVGSGNAGLAILHHLNSLRHPQPLFVDGGRRS